MTTGQFIALIGMILVYYWFHWKNKKEIIKQRGKKSDFFGLKQFKKVRLLGNGSNGFVFLARKKRKYRKDKEPKNFAIKIQKIDSTDAADTLLEPTLLMKMSACPRVIRCFFAGLSQGSNLYICMDYCPHTLLEFLAKAKLKNR